MVKQFERLTSGLLPRFTSFGCYPVLYLDQHDSVLCADCANVIDNDEDDESVISAADVNWEDPDLYCDNCSERIESAYAEPETNESEPA